MITPELWWDPGRSNWNRNRRRYARPIVEAALGQAVQDLQLLGVEPAKKITISRGINTNQEIGVNYQSDSEFEIYLQIDDIRYHRLHKLINMFTQLMVHENLHCERFKYFGKETRSVIEMAAAEGLSYSITQLVTRRRGAPDEFDEPVDFIRSMSARDIKSLREEVFAAHRELGDLPESERGEGSEFAYWAFEPLVGMYSCADAVGIHAVSSQLEKGREPKELLTLPPEELLLVA